MNRNDENSGVLITYKDCYDNALSRLTASGDEDAEFDCAELFRTFFGFDRARLFMSFDKSPQRDKLQEFENALGERCDGVPLQYIIGEWDFYDLTFKVGPGVLIPRPETELIVDYTLEFLRSVKSCDGTASIIDLCAGTGCIGITLAKNFEGCRVLELEKEDAAFSYLTENIGRNDTGRVTAVQGDLFDGFDGLMKNHKKALSALGCAPDGTLGDSYQDSRPLVIVSNPPYIRSEEIKALQREVQTEPKSALDGGVDGLDFYRAIAEKWLPHIRKGGMLITECGDEQAQEIEKLYSIYCGETFKLKDFAGIYRVVGAKF